MYSSQKTVRKQKYSFPMRINRADGPDRRYQAATMTTKFDKPDGRRCRARSMAQRNENANTCAAAAAATAPAYSSPVSPSCASNTEKTAPKK